MRQAMDGQREKDIAGLQMEFEEKESAMVGGLRTHAQAEAEQLSRRVDGGPAHSPTNWVKQTQEGKEGEGEEAPRDKTVAVGEVRLVLLEGEETRAKQEAEAGAAALVDVDGAGEERGKRRGETSGEATGNERGEGGSADMCEAVGEAMTAGGAAAGHAVATASRRVDLAVRSVARQSPPAMPRTETDAECASECAAEGWHGMAAEEAVRVWARGGGAATLNSRLVPMESEVRISAPLRESTSFNRVAVHGTGIGGVATASIEDQGIHARGVSKSGSPSHSSGCGRSHADSRCQVAASGASKRNEPRVSVERSCGREPRRCTPSPAHDGTGFSLVLERMGTSPKSPTRGAASPPSLRETPPGAIGPSTVSRGEDTPAGERQGGICRLDAGSRGDGAVGKGGQGWRRGSSDDGEGGDGSALDTGGGLDYDLDTEGHFSTERQLGCVQGEGACAGREGGGAEGVGVEDGGTDGQQAEYQQLIRDPRQECTHHHHYYALLPRSSPSHPTPYRLVAPLQTALSSPRITPAGASLLARIADGETANAACI